MWETLKEREVDFIFSLLLLLVHSLFVEGDQVGADRSVQSKDLHHTTLVQTGQKIILAVVTQRHDGVLHGWRCEFIGLCHGPVVQQLDGACGIAHGNV